MYVVFFIIFFWLIVNLWSVLHRIYVHMIYLNVITLYCIYEQLSSRATPLIICSRIITSIFFYISAQYRLDYTIMKQPGECPSSDKWSPATNYPATAYHNVRRYYNCNYYHHCYQRNYHHRHYYHHHCHYQNHRHYQHYCNHYYQFTNANRSNDKMPRNDRYHSSLHILAIFLNVLFHNPDDNDDANADADADNDKNDDEDINVYVKHDNDNNKVFLTKNVSRFMLPDILFTNCVW